MNITKKKMTEIAAIATICSGCILAVIASLATISLLVADREIKNLPAVVLALVAYAALASAQIVLSVFLYRKKEGNRFVIPLIVILCVQVAIVFVYLVAGITSFWDIFQLFISLVPLALLVYAMILKDSDSSSGDSDPQNSDSDDPVSR